MAAQKTGVGGPLDEVIDQAGAAKITLSEEAMEAARRSCNATEPWSGRALEVMTLAAARSSRPEGYPEEYDLLQTAFDHAHYFCQRPDVARARHDPVAHYMRAGWREGVDPAPWFSGVRWASGRDLEGMTPFGHWLTHGGDDRIAVSPYPHAGPLAAAEGRSEADYSTAVHATQDDIRRRLETGTLGRMVARAAGFDPLVAQTWTEATAPRVQPAHDARASARLAAFRSIADSVGSQPADAVVLVGDPRWGASRRMEGHIAQGLARIGGIRRVVILSTDKPGPLPEAKIPPGGIHVDLATAFQDLPHPDRRRLLAEVLRSLRPSIAFAVNSRLTWEALGEFGKAVAATVPLYGCMFCNDKDVFGRWGGFPATRFYRHFEDLAGICTDSHSLKRDLVSQFMVPPDAAARIAVLSAPVDPSIPVRREPLEVETGKRPQVFWSGRLDPQKRLDIAYAVARAMPGVDFRVWGRPVAGGVDPEAQRPENVTLMGSYDTFSDLPLHEASAWLYTSDWDGVPSILLEAGMTGIPIVGVRVGGTGEILRDAMCFGVDDPDDVGGLVAGLDAVLKNPAAAHERSLLLRRTLAEERTEASYVKTLESLLQEARHG